MDRIQWFIVKSDLRVTVTDLDKQKELRYDAGTGVSAGEPSFSWKVWQASPGSDSFL